MTKKVVLYTKSVGHIIDVRGVNMKLLFRLVVLVFGIVIALVLQYAIVLWVIVACTSDRAESQITSSRFEAREVPSQQAVHLPNVHTHKRTSLSLCMCVQTCADRCLH